MGRRAYSHQDRRHELRTPLARYLVGSPVASYGSSPRIDAGDARPGSGGTIGFWQDDRRGVAIAVTPPR